MTACSSSGRANPEQAIALGGEFRAGGNQYVFSTFPNSQGPSAPCVGLSVELPDKAITTMACPTEQSEVDEYAAAIQIGSGNFIVGYGLQPGEKISTADARQTFYATDSDDALFFAIELIGLPGPEPISLTITAPSGSTHMMTSLSVDQ